MAMRVDPDGAETSVIHRLIDFRDRDVLEIGCGDGRMTARFAEQARSVLAVDPDQGAIATAMEDLPRQLAGRVTFKAADVMEVALVDGAHDLVVFSRSL